ncbi:histidinol-phosphate transaminase [bacterium]|nr:histidinol-phosphate transaminase [bacterium]
MKQNGIKANQFIDNIDIYEPSVSRDKMDPSGPTPLKLDWNEATIPPSPAVKKALIDVVTNRQNSLNWYPELFSKTLIAKLSEYTGNRQDEIVATNGSDDGLALITRTFLEPGDHVVIPLPTYTHFLTHVEAAGAHIDFPTDPHPFNPDAHFIIKSLRPDTKLLYIVNPNNPTGALFTKAEIESILKAAPNTLVLVDEAYFEFAGKSVADLTSHYPNLIVSRTFSKAFAMAGLRIGYLLAHSTIITTLKKLLNPKSVNVLAQAAGIAALEHKEYTEKYVQSVTEAKALFIKFLRGRNITVFDSHANFVMIDYPGHKKLLEKLEKLNVFTRDRSNFENMDHFFRVTLGTIEQTEELIKRFTKVL